MKIACIAGQPGAEAFFRPVLAQVRRNGGRILFLSVWNSFNKENLNGDVVDCRQSLDDFNPDLILLSTTHHLEERKAFDWTREKKIPCVELIDSWYYYARRIFGTNGGKRFPEAIMLLDELAIHDAVSEGLPRRLLYEVGNPDWENISELPPVEGGSILYIDQPVGDDLECDLGYSEFDALDILIESIQKSRIDYDLTLALHPRRQNHHFQNYEGYAVSRSADEAIYSSSLVVGMFSSFLVKAFLSGRQVLSINPKSHLCQDMCVLSRISLIPKISGPVELKDCISASPIIINEFRQKFTHSTQRVLSLIERII